MRTTDFCFPLPDYEHPRLVSYRHLFETYASPVAIGLAPVTRRPVDLAFHDAESASVGFTRLTRGMLLRRSRSNRTSDTSVAPGPPARAFAQGDRPGLPRPFPSSLREDETLSTTRGAFHRWRTLTPCVSRRQSRSRSRVFPRRSGPRRPFTHGARATLSRGPSYRALDPRPCPSPRLALFTRCADGRFSGSGYRPTTSATDYPTHGHTPEPPVFALRTVPSLSRVDVEGDLAFACFLGHATFPSRRRITRAANRGSPSGTDRATMQARRSARPRKPSPDRHAACGRRPDPTTACGDGRWKTALDCTGRAAPSKGPSLPPPAAAGPRG
jgi:hypothetical protein